jgi:hypothetical protein
MIVEALEILPIVSAVTGVDISFQTKPGDSDAHELFFPLKNIPMSKSE